jgi:hypothetical protein
MKMLAQMEGSLSLSGRGDFSCPPFGRLKPPLSNEREAIFNLPVKFSLKVSFGIIVFNGEPFTRYCLRQLYPFAHEILVVEGATESARHLASETGHSTDGTLEVLFRFKEEEDPEDKVVLITKEGCWEEKDEMSQAYAIRATGDYLWQVDIDEFYRWEDMRAVLEILQRRPEVTSVSFKTYTFWGRPEYTVHTYKQRTRHGDFHRLFRWGPGCRYISHRPPTVVDEKGRDLRSLRPIPSNEMARRGIYLYHYSMLFPKQVREKCLYYENLPWRETEGLTNWAERNYFALSNPFNVGLPRDVPSWIQRFHGDHPEAICQLMEDVESGRVGISFRNREDVEDLLNSTSYRAKRFLLRSYPVYVIWWAVGPYGRHRLLIMLRRLFGSSIVDRFLFIWRRLKKAFEV